jgi:hypothetical protein
VTIAPQPRDREGPLEPVLFEDALSYTPVPKSVRLVRQRAVRLVGEWGQAQLAGEVALLLSEAATNAVVHARVPGRLFRVRMALTATRLRGCGSRCRIRGRGWRPWWSHGGRRGRGSGRAEGD